MNLDSINARFWDELKRKIGNIGLPQLRMIQTGGLRIEHAPVSDEDFWYSDKSGSGKYRLIIGDTKHPFHNHSVISTWELWQMKNCCGICVSTAVQVAEPYRKIGIGELLNKVRIHTAKLDGYGLLLCTDVLSNEPQQKILKANGWDCVKEFKNPRTGNDIGIHTVDLSKVDCEYVD